MKVTQVAIRPTEASESARRPALTPELLAASGARYSRNNEGLEAILARIDPEHLDRSVDAIFKMIDYGHQSIADMAPVAIFIDGISIWLAYCIWSLCPTAGGQESSTRYVKMSVDVLISPDELEIPYSERDAWLARMAQAFSAYAEALSIWESIFDADPSVARIPKSLLDDPSDKAARQVARMRRNYAYDRARYYLPVAAGTNMMMVMSARGWVQLCQVLLSHPLPEARRCGELIQAELSLAAPRLLRHATAKDSIRDGLARQFEQLRHMANTETLPQLDENSNGTDILPTPFLDILPAQADSPEDLASDLGFHDNRYAWMGDSLRRTDVRFGWSALAFAEIRDLNRHRTGSKYCPLIPLGFYSAMDALPLAAGNPDANEGNDQYGMLWRLNFKAALASADALGMLRAGMPEYVYSTFLGTQYLFEHTTTADKFLYEAELRTGIGAHFRYALHFHDVLALWYEKYPETKGLVLEGSAEPE